MPSRSAEAAERGRSSQGTEVAGIDGQRPQAAPRWALTANRNEAGVAASQPSIAASVGLR